MDEARIIDKKRVSQLLYAPLENTQVEPHRVFLDTLLLLSVEWGGLLYPIVEGGMLAMLVFNIIVLFLLAGGARPLWNVCLCKEHSLIATCYA